MEVKDDLGGCGRPLANGELEAWNQAAARNRPNEKNLLRPIIGPDPSVRTAVSKSGSSQRSK
jgi:hypothetical protein